MQAIEHWQNQTCLRFKSRIYERDYVLFVKEIGLATPSLTSLRLHMGSNKVCLGTTGVGHTWGEWVACRSCLLVESVKGWG